MLPRRALSALQAARSRTLCRALGLPLKIAPSLRSLSTTGRISEPEGGIASQLQASRNVLPASLLAKLRSSGKPARSAAGSQTAFTAHQADAQAEPSSSKSSAEGSASVPAQAPESTTDKFTNLKGKINYDVYKALTQRPFNFEKMSSVQEAVLNLLPGLAQTTAAVEGSESNAVNERADLLVKAKTGTGKTVAFLVPALEARFNDIKDEQERFKAANPGADANTVSRHMARYTKDTVGTIILSPTRELATQIATEAAKLMTHCKGMDVRLFIGGASKGMQLRDFERRRRDIIVATPGRMNDMLSIPMVRDQVAKAKVLVLDEADTLLDMGFKDAIDSIVEHMPPKGERQTFLFSATVSPEIRKIARSTLRKDHKFIDCVPLNETNTHLHIPQYSSVLPSADQQFTHIARLLAHDALLNPQGGKAIIFLPTTKMTELTSMLVKAMRPSLPWGIRGTRIFEMHSKKTQSARDRTSEEFRSQSGPGYSILVTSDVSARGVDYPGVTRVIQVGVPGSKDTYVHRVGRTGRAGKAGRGDIVLLPWEESYIRSTLQDIPLKPIDTEGLQAELETLATELDANPPRMNAAPAPMARSRFGGRAPPGSSVSAMQHPVLPRLQGLERRVTEDIIPEISPLDASEAFGSQLGFYVGRSPELGMSRGEIYEALQEWATTGLGLAQPPQVSQKMQQMLGLGKTNRGGKMRGFGQADGRRRGYEDLRSFRNDGPRNPFRPFQSDHRSFSNDRRDRGQGRSSFGRPAFGGRGDRDGRSSRY
ncbi:DEAD-domain-containing protein [Cystobasidium minutum MCA 4210]|uniref:DEAD-domain-containing protein n=1 Tax=Cystobasidium minutum MCA 4210 TaxID=1397322 RepID=UPI0034CF114E|eukprot:jgi/Rhomi1/197555/gm1.5769_g